MIGRTLAHYQPGNIMITDDNQLKLMDFGLAKLSNLHDATDAELTRPVSADTEEGSTLGTVCYMSPEQAEAPQGGRTLGHFQLRRRALRNGYRTEGVSGPFLGRSRISTLAAVLDAGLPRELARIIQRCLRKDPAWRYQSAADLKISLHGS